MAFDTHYAKELWTQAAENGHPQAQFALGALLAKGDAGYVLKDELRGKHYLLMAQKNGIKEATALIKKLRHIDY